MGDNRSMTTQPNANLMHGAVDLGALAAAREAQEQAAARRADPTAAQVILDVTEATFEQDVIAASQNVPVVVDLWASWCGPCRLEAPVLEQVWQRYGGEVAFVGIAHNDTLQRAQSFLARYGVTFPNGVDINGRVADAYGVTALPETYVIDAEGIVRAHRLGAIVEAEALVSLIEEALSVVP